MALVINRRWFGYGRERGVAFAVTCVPLHLLYFLYSGLTVYVWLALRARVRRRRSADRTIAEIVKGAPLMTAAFDGWTADASETSPAAMPNAPSSSWAADPAGLTAAYGFSRAPWVSAHRRLEA